MGGFQKGGSLDVWYISDPGSDFCLFQDSLAREFEFTNIESGILSALHNVTTTYRHVRPNFEPYRRWLLDSTTRDHRELLPQKRVH